MALLCPAWDYAQKKTGHASEQDRPDVLKRREEWFEGQLDLDPDRLVFIDETWASTNMARRHGRCRRGQRLRAGIPFGHWKTTTFTAGLRRTGMVAPWVLDGPMNADAFLTYVTRVLVPELDCGDVVIMTAGAGRCETRAIRQDELDSIVLSVLTDRILQRDRLIELLQAVLEKSDTADAQRHQDLERIRREKVEAEKRMRRLLEALEEGVMSAKDPLFAERLTQHRQNVAQLDASARSLTLQLERGPQRISEETIAKFGKLISEQLRDGNPALRKAYVRLLIDNVRVDNQTIHIQGSKAALESAVVRDGDAAISMVPGFDRKWCAYRTHNYPCRPEKSSGFGRRFNWWPPRGPHQIRSHFWRRTCVDWDTVHCI